MKFGIHNPSWLYGPDPAQAFEAVKAVISQPLMVSVVHKRIRKERGSCEAGYKNWRSQTNTKLRR